MFEMLDKLNTNIEQGFAEINKRIDNTNKRIDDTNKRIDETNTRIDNTNKRINETNTRIDDTNRQMNIYFDEVSTRFDTIDERIVGIGAHFEELSKNTIEVQDALTKDTKYLKHKVGELEQEVFFLSPEQ